MRHTQTSNRLAPFNYTTLRLFDNQCNHFVPSAFHLNRHTHMEEIGRILDKYLKTAFIKISILKTSFL